MTSRSLQFVLTYIVFVAHQVLASNLKHVLSALEISRSNCSLEAWHSALQNNHRYASYEDTLIFITIVFFLVKKQNILVPNAVEKSRTDAFRTRDQTLSFVCRPTKRQSLWKWLSSYEEREWSLWRNNSIAPSQMLLNKRDHAVVTLQVYHKTYWVGCLDQFFTSSLCYEFECFNLVLVLTKWFQACGTTLQHKCCVSERE